MLDFLLQDDMQESMSTSCLERLCLGLVALAARGHYSWTEKLYYEVICKSTTALWTSTLGSRLIYLSQSHGWLSFVSQLTKNMVAAVCHHFVCGSSDSKSGSIPMMRCFTLMSCMYSRPFQKEDIKEIQLSLGIFRSILKLKHLKQFFFHVLCARGMYDHICYILDIVSASVREQLFQMLDSFRSPLFHAAIHGHMDVVSLLVERGCPLIHPSPDAYSELNALLQLNSKKLSLHFDKFELRYGRYNPDIIQFFASECDFSHIVNFTDYFCILLSVALLPKLDIAQPILKSLLGHLEPLQAHTWDGNSDRTTLGRDCLDVQSRADVRLLNLKTDRGFHSSFCDAFSSKVKDRTATIINVLHKSSASSQESLDLMDAIMCKIITWKLDGDLVLTASDRGLWLVVQNSLPEVSHDDDSILHILFCALKQRRHDFFSSICTRLREEGRHFNVGFTKILCAAVKFNNASAVELLLELGEKDVDLVPPLTRAVASHLHPLAFMFLSKMAAESSVCVPPLHKIIQAAVRCKNHHVITELMVTNYLQSFQLSLAEKVSLWFVVLKEAARCGQEYFALQAISSLSYSQLQQIQMDEGDAYHRMLSWCCFWGMTDTLNCLPLTIQMLLTPVFSTTDDLDLEVDCKTSYGNTTSPWCCAEGNGNVGKLSHLNCLDLTPSPPPPLALTEGDSQFLTLGVFSKIVAGNSRSDASHSINCFPAYCKNLVLRQAYFGLTEQLVTFFEHLGTKKSHFQVLCQRFGGINYFPQLLFAACSRRNNFPAVQLILKYLADSGLYIDDHPKVVESLVHSIRMGEVGYAQALIHYIPDLLVYVNVNLLTYAILSKKPEMVNYILDHFPDCSPIYSLQQAPCLHNPLWTALSLGCSSVIHNSSLASVTLKVSEFAWSSWMYESSCLGWFNLMMENNRRAISSNRDPNVESTTSFDIRSFRMSFRKTMDSKHMMLSLLHSSTTHQDHSMTEAILQASAGMISESDLKEMLKVVAEILLDETVYNFMSSHGHCEEILHSFQSKAEEFDMLKIMLEKFLNSCIPEDKIIRLLQLFHPLSTDVSICKYALLNSCEFGKSQVAEHLLTGSDFGEEMTSILQAGATTAVCNGHFGIAADIMLKLNITHIEVEKNQTTVRHLIFSKPHYFTILDKFFASMIDPTQRMPLAALWLVYDWSEGEAELVVSELGSMYAPPNPWLLPRGKSDLTITIDWDSFSESLLSSPDSLIGHKNSGCSRYVPLVVEATVFTQAVLGHLVPSSFTSGRAFQNPRDADFLSVIQSLSSVILTCTVWPNPPSFSSFETKHGILTISYQPSLKSFVFPDLAPTSTDASVGASGELGEMGVSTIISENFESLSRYYENKVQAILRHPCKAKVNISDGLIREMEWSLETGGMKSCDLYHMLASAVLQDILDALKLSLLPKSSPPSLSLLQNVASSVDILLDCDSDEGDQPVLNISMENSVLSIVVYLPCGKFSLETSELNERSFYNKLVDDTLEVILREHVRLAQHDSKLKMEKMVASMLFVSFKLISMPTVTVDVTPDDVVGEFLNSNNLSLGGAQSLFLYIKCVKKLQLYLKYFCRMLKEFQHMPELCTSLCTLFEGCFHITLTTSATDPIFEIDQGRKRLVVPVECLQTKKRLYSSLLHTLRQLMSSFTLSENPFSSLNPSIPAPFACYVDYQESQGLLFPVMGTQGTITVQMVNYNGDHFKDYITGTATLKVRIRHLKSKSIIEGSSSSTPHGTGKWLAVIDDSNGTFKIEWTPQNIGLHSICLCINGISIEGSPYRCYCAGLGKHVADRGGREGARKLTTDEAAVFLVQHLSECPLTSKSLPIKLYNRNPIRPLTLPTNPISRESFISELCHGPGPIHHISLSSAFCGARNRFLVVGGGVAIHIWTGDKITSSSFRVADSRLANGLHYVSLQSTRAASFSFFASCSFCQSVMKMHWKGEHSLWSTSLSVTHGKIDPRRSTMRMTNHHCDETITGQWTY